MNVHPFVLVKSDFFGEVQIDEEIAPIITLLWARGIDTIGCCQKTCDPFCQHESHKVPGYPHEGDIVWISFFRTEFVCKFLNAMPTIPNEWRIVDRSVYFPCRDISFVEGALGCRNLTTKHIEVLQQRVPINIIRRLGLTFRKLVGR